MPYVRVANAEDGTHADAPPGYEILGVLGRGGMGIVYKARQVKAGRVVALKMILAGSHAGAEEVARFRTEAEAVARLQHPAIVQVFEVGEHNGLPFFSLELCPGGSLNRKLAGTPLQPREAAVLVEKLSRGLQAAHEAKVLHRDMKPANVLLAADGAPKIADFGLAKKLGEQGQTVTGAVMGTPSYMAPEQADGRSKTVGPAVDVYALGAILYECLTGRPPFRAATILDTLQQVIAREPVAPRQLNPKIPRDLETIALKCLRKEAGKRYSSAAELADDLKRYLRKEPIRARRTGPLERAVKWVRRNPLGAALALALAAGTAGSSWFALEARQQAAAARNNANDLAEETRNLEQARDEAESMLIEGLLRPIGRTAGPLPDVESDALTRLSQLPSARLRLRFLQDGLSTAETARRLDQRAEWIIQTIVGLDRQRRHNVQELLMQRLQAPDAADEIKAACVALGIALEIRDSSFEGLARASIHAETVRRLQRNDVKDLPDRLRAVSDRLDAAAAGQIAEMLAAALGQTNNEESLIALSEALRAVSARLNGNAAGKTAEVLQTVLGKAADALATKGTAGDPRIFSSLAQTLIAVNDRLDAADAAVEAGKVADLVFRTMSKNINSYNLTALTETLKGVSRQLPEAARRKAADVLLTRIGKAADWTEVSLLSEALKAVSDRLDAAQASKVANGLLEAMSKAAHASALSALGFALRTVSRRLEDNAVSKLVDSLLASLAQASQTRTVFWTSASLEALSDRLDGADAVRVADALAAAMNRVAASPAFLSLCGALSKAMAAANVSLNDSAAVARLGKTADLLLGSMNRLSDPQALFLLATGLKAIASRLDGVRAATTAATLLSALRRTHDQRAAYALSEVLALVNNALDTAVAAHHANEAADLLLAAINRTSDTGTHVLLIQALARLSSRLDADRLRQTADALQATMTKAARQLHLVLLCDSLALVRPRLDAVTALVSTNKAMDRLLTEMSKTSELVVLGELTTALQVLSEQRTTGEILELMRRPLTAGPCQRALLDVLGRRTHREFRTTWQFLDWMHANGLAVADVVAS
jgi:tRNA A-37 threonylcarbamoyl transferase component Bud32